MLAGVKLPTRGASGWRHMVAPIPSIMFFCLARGSNVAQQLLPLWGEVRCATHATFWPRVGSSSFPRIRFGIRTCLGGTSCVCFLLFSLALPRARLSGPAPLSKTVSRGLVGPRQAGSGFALGQILYLSSILLPTTPSYLGPRT